MAAQRCYLLELPPELRLLIYQEILAVSVLYIDLKPLSEGQSALIHVSHTESKRRICYPAILQTCRQVYEEASNILYQPLRLALTFGHPAPPKWPAATDLAKFWCTRRLQKLYIFWPLYRNDDQDFLIQMSILLSKAATTVNNAENLHLALPWRSKRLEYENMLPGVRHCFRTIRARRVTVEILGCYHDIHDGGRAIRREWGREWQEFPLPKKLRRRKDRREYFDEPRFFHPLTTPVSAKRAEKLLPGLLQRVKEVFTEATGTL